MSRFHNSVEGEKLALGWHWFAFAVWVVELFTAALQATAAAYTYVTHYAPLELQRILAIVQVILALIIFVLGVFALAFHVKAVCDHRDHLNSLRKIAVFPQPPKDVA